MQEKQEDVFKFGLVGKNISYSFSRKYFSDKFDKLNLTEYEYVNFDIDSIEDFPLIIYNNENLKGLNVTIPYKEEILQFLDEIDNDAQKIGAVNTIKILPDRKLKGYNTDAYGFENSIKPFLKKHHQKALILGTGGASKAIKFTLDKLEINSKFVSRNPKGDNMLSYKSLSKQTFQDYHIIINCTPLGTFPNTDKHPAIDFDFLTEKHLLFDLIYNPSKSSFLKKGEAKGTSIANGLRMLELQAEEAWRIWNS